MATRAASITLVPKDLPSYTGVVVTRVPTPFSLKESDIVRGGGIGQDGLPFQPRGHKSA